MGSAVGKVMVVKFKLEHVSGEAFLGFNSDVEEVEKDAAVDEDGSGYLMRAAYWWFCPN